MPGDIGGENESGHDILLGDVFNGEDRGHGNKYERIQIDSL